MLERIQQPQPQIAIAAVRDRMGVAEPGEFVAAVEGNLSLKAIFWMVEKRLGGLLLDRLAHHGLDDLLPEPEGTDVRRIAVGAVIGETLRMRALARVLEVLEPAGFAVYAIKGAALSAVLPEHSALRPSCDLDLWVPGPAAGAANELLLQTGFVRRDAATPEDPRKWHCQPVCSPEGVLVELHRRPWICPRNLTTGPVRSMRLGHPLVPGGVPTPGVEEQVAIHAVHAALSRTTPGHVLTLWDIAALAQAFEIDWSIVANLVRSLGAMRGLRAVMSRVALLGLTEVPPEVRMSPAEEGRVVFRAVDSEDSTSALRAIWLRRRAVDSLSNWLGSARVALPTLPPPDRRFPGLVARRLRRGMGELLAAVRSMTGGPR